MEKADIKTIDITTKTWFDKVNGNTYFAQRITLNYGLSDELTVINPYQYGYSSYEFEAFKCLKNELGIEFSNTQTLRDLNIILRSNTYKNCKLRELKNI